MSVSSTRLCVRWVSKWLVLDTSVAMTFGPGIMDRMYDNVAITRCSSGAESWETFTLERRSWYPVDTGYDFVE